MRRGLFWVNPRLGKVERAIEQTPKIERKRVYLPVSAPWLETFEAEVATFPLSQYCDQVELDGAFPHVPRSSQYRDDEAIRGEGISGTAILSGQSQRRPFASENSDLSVSMVELPRTRERPWS